MLGYFARSGKILGRVEIKVQLEVNFILWSFIHFRASISKLEFILKSGRKKNFQKLYEDFFNF